VTGSRRLLVGRRLAVASVVCSGLLAVVNLLVGWKARSTSVVAAGFEFTGDVLASAVVVVGLAVASKPPDEVSTQSRNVPIRAK